MRPLTREQLIEIWDRAGRTSHPAVFLRDEPAGTLLRAPYRDDNYGWLRQEGRPRPKWNKAERHWELPKAWFEELVPRVVERFGSAVVIRPTRGVEKCASSCWDSESPAWMCECSCGGANHGERRKPGFKEIKDSLAVKWDPKRRLSVTLVTPEGAFSIGEVEGDGPKGDRLPS